MVKFHALSPISEVENKKLFHHVISQSGQSMVYNPDPLVSAREFGNLTGCNFQQSANFLDCIQSLPLDSILNASTGFPIINFTLSRNFRSITSIIV